MSDLKSQYVSIHFYNERLSFPVMLLAKKEQESQIILNYLTEEKTYNFNVIDFINWSDAHSIDIHILFPNFIKLIKLSIKDPMRFKCYYYIKKRIRKAKQYVSI